MRVNRIALNGFRNYDFETAELSPGTNVIYGENAQGKTNLLEAVYILAAGRSFRTRFDRELIGFGCDRAEILADIVSHEREQTVRIVMRNGVRKQITVNSVKKTATELAGTLTAVLFSPDDLNLIKDGAAARRPVSSNTSTSCSSPGNIFRISSMRFTAGYQRMMARYKVEDMKAIYQSIYAQCAARQGLTWDNQGQQAVPCAALPQDK